jgi:membrane protein DedA with SNARE-associated domain
MIIQAPNLLLNFAPYTYFILFPITIVEGPIITILAGFLASINQINLAIALVVIVLGDLTGDCLYYAIGRFGRHRLPRWLNFLGMTKERIAFLEEKFLEHPKKIFSIGKISHGVGAAALVAAGVTKFPFRRFLLYNFILTVIKSGILILIGFYFGQALSNIETYMNYWAASAAVGLIILYLIFLRYTKNYKL